MPDKILINSGPSERGWHRLESFARCPMLYAWYQLGAIKEAKSEPLIRGSICHVGLAHLYNRMIPGVDSSLYHSPVDAMWLAAEEFQAENTLTAKCVELVKAYAHHWGVENCEVLGVETPFETEFYGYRYTARVDWTVRDHIGMWFIDHKITGRLTGAISKRYQCSGQMLGLWHLGKKHFGDEFAGVKVNLMQFDPPTKFHREQLDLPPLRLRQFPRDVQSLEKRIEELTKTTPNLAEWPGHPSEHTCFHSYGICPAYDLCQYGMGKP